MTQRTTYEVILEAVGHTSTPPSLPITLNIGQKEGRWRDLSLLRSEGRKRWRNLGKTKETWRELPKEERDG